MADQTRERIAMDAVTILNEFLRDNGIGPWVTDAYNRTCRREDWAEDFLLEDAPLAFGNEVQAYQDVCAWLTENPKRKMISIKDLNALLNRKQS